MVRSPRPHVNPFKISVKLYDLNWTINFIKFNVGLEVLLCMRSQSFGYESRVNPMVILKLDTRGTTHTPNDYLFHNFLVNLPSH